VSPILGIVASSKNSFTPASIANLKAWYDASDTATITVSGSAVTQWNDKSANAYNLTQGTSARRPVSGTRTQNGLNMIDFQGDDVLQAATAANWTFLSDGTNATIFMAAFYDTSSIDGYLYTTSLGSSSNPGMTSFRYGSSNDNLGVQVTGTSPTDGQRRVNVLNGGQLTDNTAKYYSLKLDIATSTAADRFKARINGGAEVATNTANSTLNTNTATTALLVGSYNTAGSEGFDGGLCEFIIYSGILSDDNILLVNNYLASKWAI